MSGGKFFLDTNIFVYAFVPDSPSKLRRAQELIGEGAANHKGTTSYQVVQEFINVALRRFAKPMTTVELERYLSTVFQAMTVVHSSMPLSTEAIRLQDRYRLSWYDALIVAAAIESDCSILYSEDLQHGQRFGATRIRDPFR